MSLIELLLRTEALNGADIADLMALVWSDGKMDAAFSLQEVEQ